VNHQMNWKRMTAVLTACAAMCCGSAVAQDTGTALKADELKAEPFKDANTIGKLAKGDKVDIVARQSGWLQVRAGGKTGWVRMLSVRRGQTAQKDAGKEISGVAGLATGRAGTGQVVSSTGVRGLSDEDLKNAKFDESQIAQAESNAVSAADAKTFAGQGRLTPQKVAFLPEPKRGAR
jgi:uncharacterized protein YgiM (DUF1202 family)